MTKQEINSRLIENHERFATLISGFSDEDFMFAPESKWTSGQQLEHIYRSVLPLKLALSLPKWLLKAYFGKANRPSRDYDSLVARYKMKLEAGYKAGSRFLPQPVELSAKEKLTGKLKKTVNSLVKQLGSYSEEQLDLMIAPHPLLGKLTLREMMYFTIYHVEHHQILTLKNLEGRKNR